jgi:hypothetical protein
MSVLADTQYMPSYVAPQKDTVSLVQAFFPTLTSFGRALEFSRYCEAEYNRTGRVDTDRIRNMMADLWRPLAFLIHRAAYCVRRPNYAFVSRAQPDCPANLWHPSF